MGQREEYLKSSDMWAPELTRRERLDRWWYTASFGLALSGRAARAVATADQAVAAAEAAAAAVKHQAVYALLAEDLSVREIAQRLGLTKSTVGRIAKRLTVDGERGNFGVLAPRGQEEATQAHVLAAWGFPDVDSATVDHVRGRVEAEPTDGSI